MMLRLKYGKTFLLVLHIKSLSHEPQLSHAHMTICRAGKAKEIALHPRSQLQHG